jgi:two-component system cell cycle sensor histidine kinase PleC
MVDGLAEVLRTRGYEVKTANNEEEAFALIKEFDAQLALLDIRLGKTSGLDLIKSLKEYRPNMQSIMITGNADRESAIAALQRGAYNYLTKPLHPDELFAIMDTCLDKYELDEKLRASFEELQVAKEEAEEKIRHISGFYGEIGTSVDAMVKEIQAVSDKLGQTGEDGGEDRLQLVKNIHGIAARIENIVNNAADLAKLKAFTLELDEGAVDICKLVSNCVRAAQETMGDGGPQVKVSVPEESVPVWGDERLLRLVILNLLSNSVDFTPEDGDITLSVRREENGDPVIQVSDTSTGMPIEKIREAVQNFGRKMDAGGANGSLDIVLVSNIARLHDGALDFVSNPDGGVTARITLPAKRVFSAQSAA